MSARCSACRAEVWFGVTPAGKRMPLDPAPVVDGNVVVDRTRPATQHPALPRVRVLRKTDVVDADVPRYRSHFATCPEADRFRRQSPPVASGRAGRGVIVSLADEVARHNAAAARAEAERQRHDLLHVGPPPRRW